MNLDKFYEQVNAKPKIKDRYCREADKHVEFDASYFILISTKIPEMFAVVSISLIKFKIIQMSP